MLQGYTYHELGGWLVLRPLHGKLGWGGKVQTDINYIRGIRLIHIYAPKDRDKMETGGRTYNTLRCMHKH